MNSMNNKFAGSKKSTSSNPSLPYGVIKLQDLENKGRVNNPAVDTFKPAKYSQNTNQLP